MARGIRLSEGKRRLIVGARRGVTEETARRLICCVSKEAATIGIVIGLSKSAKRRRRSLSLICLAKAGVRGILLTKKPSGRLRGSIRTCLCRRSANPVSRNQKVGLTAETESWLILSILAKSAKSRGAGIALAKACICGSACSRLTKKTARGTCIGLTEGRCVCRFTKG